MKYRNYLNEYSKCKKCSKFITFDECLYNDHLCYSCKSDKTKKFIITASIFVFLGIIIGSVMGVVEYQYELTKCYNLSSIESAYNFDNKIEINAEYNSHCYFLNNHPLAIYLYVFVGSSFGLICFILGSLIFHLIMEIIK